MKEDLKPVEASVEESKDEKLVRRGDRIQDFLRPLVVIFTVLGIILVPQIIIAFAFFAYSASQGKDIAEVIDLTIGQNFAIYGATQLLTLGVLLFVIKLRKQKISSLGYVKKGLPKIWMTAPAFFAYLVMTLIVTAVSSIFLSSEVLNQEQELGFDGAVGYEIALAFLALVIIAPIAEETLFRGFLFKNIRKHWSFGVSAFVSALLFAIAHFQINVGLDTFVLGLVLAALAEYTHGIWASVLLHAIKNGIAFTFLFLLSEEALESISVNIDALAKLVL